MEVKEKSASIDYSKIGFKAGLEIHQQLDTGKLFCNCPGILRSDEPNFVIKRKLHKVAGEGGKVDEAVEHEAGLDRDFYYQGYYDSTCLIELDEEPPRMINQNALDETLKIALLLNCEIYQNVQVMRKTVINGSNTSGFQRTFLVGHSGFVETSFGKVKIDSVALEEDSARIIEKDNKKAVYRLDRLGIPLVEIGTSPDMFNPEQVKECALKIGEVLRACKVKRGIGTIRQDVNVSIKGHDRVEIKGFQDPRMMVKTIDLEIERQKKESKEGRKNGEVRNAKEDGSTEFLRPMPGEARMYPETDLPLLKIGRDKINEIKSHLPKMKNEIRDELKKEGLSEELISLVLEEGLDEYSALIKVWDKDANLIGKMVTLWRKEIANKMKKSFEEMRNVLTERVLEQILEAMINGKISEADVRAVMFKIAEGNKVEDAVKIEIVEDDKLEEEIIKIIKEKPGLREGAYMGLIIGKLGKDVNKRKAMEILQKHLNK